MDEKTNGEWLRLKQLVSRLNGEEFDGERFEWQSPSDFSLLKLKDVAASFRGAENVPPRVYFRLRSPQRGHVWPGPSPVRLVTWCLQPSTEGSNFAWQVRESSEDDIPGRRFWTVSPFPRLPL